MPEIAENGVGCEWRNSGNLMLCTRSGMTLFATLSHHLVGSQQHICWERPIFVASPQKYYAMQNRGRRLCVWLNFQQACFLTVC